jgi:hypothetical protein
MHSNFSNRKVAMTLPPIPGAKTSKETGKMVAWRDVYILVKVPVQQAVTDKTVRSWVADALKHYDAVHSCSLANYCHPSAVGSPQVKEYHRYVRGKHTAAKWKAARDAKVNGKIPDEIE